MTVESISCFLCSAILFWSVYSEKYLHFVTPKMKYYIYFAVIVFFLWGIYEVDAGKKQKYKRRLDSYYLLFAIAAFLMIACIHSDLLSNGTTQVEEIMLVGKARSDSQLKEAISESEKKIIVTSDNYLAWINELRVNSHKYTGYTITIDGSMGGRSKENSSFYLIRWYMSCCAADVVPIGIMCEMKGDNTIEEETFVRIEGVVQCNHTEDGESAKILVKKITKIPEPKEKYIYS